MYVTLLSSVIISSPSIGHSQLMISVGMTMFTVLDAVSRYAGSHDSFQFSILAACALQ